MAKRTLAERLRIQAGQRMLILNQPPGYVEGLGELPEGVEVAHQPEGEGEFDFVHLFVKEVAELEQLGPVALGAVKYDGLLWISYPKGSSGVKTDINRDSLWKILVGKGIRPVTQISIDEVWSALRFRPSEAVGK